MPPTHIGKYSIIGALGQGAMGEVYLGEDPYIARRVAIKLMKTAADEDEQRFLHEARIVGSFSHPNIVTLHEFGFQDGRPFLVMEYVAGSNLEAWLRLEHPLADHLRIMEGLVAAIRYAHGKGVLHRDLKPSNIQVMPDGQCKLMDFGIARAPAAKLTATGMIMGTPSYLAPEILEDALYSPRADIFSVGVVFYEMLSGGNPFAARTVSATLHNVLTTKPPELSKLRPELPIHLCDAIMDCLAKDPRERLEDLSPLAHAIAEAQASVPSLTKLPSRAPAFSTPTRSILDLPSTRRKRLRKVRRLTAVAVLVPLALAAWFVLHRPAGQAPPSPADSVAPSPASIPPPSAAPINAPRPTVLPSSTEPGAPRKAAAKPAVRSSPPITSAPVEAAPALMQPSAPPTAGAERAAPPPTAPSVTAPPEEPPMTSISGISPHAANRGIAVTLEIRGSGIRPDHRARVLQGTRDAEGIRVTRQVMVDATRLRVTLLVDEDARLGTYSLALVDANGRSTNSLSLEVVL